MRSDQPPIDEVAHAVRMALFTGAAETGQVPQAAEIAESLKRPLEDVRAALRRLADARVLILAPNDGDVWAANPFCAVPSGFRVEADDRRWWGICAWDALGVIAAVGAREARMSAPCGDCGETIELRVEAGELLPSDAVVHFAVPARAWWKNIGFA